MRYTTLVAVLVFGIFTGLCLEVDWNRPYLGLPGFVEVRFRPLGTNLTLLWYNEEALKNSLEFRVEKTLRIYLDYRP